MNNQAKRNLGTAFGLAMGLICGIISQFVNPFILSSIPLYQSPIEHLAAILSITGCGAAAGRLAAWSNNTFRSVASSAATGALLSTLISIFIIGREAQNQTGVLRLIFVYWLPRAVILFGAAWLVRQVIKIWENELKSVMFSLTKMILPCLGLLVIAFFLGLLSIYPKAARSALYNTRELIEDGLSSGNYTQLPPVLLPVDGFLEEARGRYSLQLSDNPYRLPIQLPLGAHAKREYAVLVRFENGFRFACAYINTIDPPACGEF